MVVTAQKLNVDKISADALVLLIPQNGNDFTSQYPELTILSEVAASLAATPDFRGARDTSTIVYTGQKNLPRLILIGCGELSKVSLEQIRRSSALAVQKAAAVKCKSIAVILPTFDIASTTEIAQAIVEGIQLGSYTFDKYFTEKFSSNPPVYVEKAVLLTGEGIDLKEAKRGVEIGSAISNGVVLARDLTNAPSNEIYPESLAQRAMELSKHGVKVSVLNKTQITKLGMGGLLAVNQGSTKPPVFIIMEWKGGKSGDKPVVLVGKGVTFDSGGISIKPSAGMGEMKTDMGGAAAVIGTIRAAAELKLPINLVGLVPSTENLPSGSAYKPGDVITFLNGKTAEIDNTDAEGRLILADALTYADRYKPQAVVDLATLTGACVIALGYFASGLMGNTPALNERIKEAGTRSYDRVVELPLWEEYEESIKSDIADVKNTGGRAAGSITAGLFLQHFIGSYPWAHLDIAGTSTLPKSLGYLPKGATGAGVRLLIDMLRNWKPL